MHLKAIIPIVLGLILLSSPVLAQELFQYEVNVEIYQDFSATYDEKFIFSNSAFDNFVIPIEGDIKNIQLILDDKGGIYCDQYKKSWGTEINCDTSERSGQNFNIIVKYGRDSVIESTEDNFVFRESIKSPISAKNMLLLVKVPEGMGLIEKTGESLYEQPFLPASGSVGSDGRRPIIVWERKPASAGDGIDVSIVFEPIVSGYSDGTVATLLAILISIIIAVSVYYRFYGKRKSNVKVVMPILKHDEKLVVEALMKAGGKDVNQKIIVKDSNYSKAKVSKVLKSLQERGIITLERIGRKNKVSLVREFKKEEQKDSGNN